MNFVQVTRDEFFARMNPLNVHPSPEVDVTYWRLPNRTMVGKSTPGWKRPGDPKEWFLVRPASN